jgi:hypothetical protein
VTVGIAAAVRARRGFPVPVCVVDSIQAGGRRRRRETRLLGAVGARGGGRWHSAVVVSASTDGVAARVADTDLYGLAAPCGRAVEALTFG